jgi:UDP-3-O-[3-hydroxymyristoyl] glucosamine N-acyltransferase
MRNPGKLGIKEIAEMTGGEISGNSDVIIEGANTLENAKKGEITFLANPKYRKWLDKTNASCVLISSNLKVDVSVPMIKVENPDVAFGKVLERLYGGKVHPIKDISKKANIDENAIIEKNVRIGDFVNVEAGARIDENTIIYPNVYIGGDTKIGKNCLIYPNVSVMDSVRIGDNVIIHSGAVIGSDGFGYSTINGRHVKVPQVGSVVIEDDVEIGANSSIDRGSPGNTVIGKGTKIDNLVQIAHNVRIGENCFLCAQVGIAGSTIVEDNVFLAGQAGVVGHITIGACAKVGAQAGVTRDIKPGQLVSGYPAMNHIQARKINALVKKLPKLFKEVEQLNKIIGRKR